MLGLDSRGIQLLCCTHSTFPAFYSLDLVSHRMNTACMGHATINCVMLPHNCSVAPQPTDRVELFKKLVTGEVRTCISPPFAILIFGPLYCRQYVPATCTYATLVTRSMMHLLTLPVCYCHACYNRCLSEWCVSILMDAWF